MKCPLELLKKFIDLPSSDPMEVRTLIEETVSAVKDVLDEPYGKVYNIETLACRGDQTCVIGVARELSGRVLSALKIPQVANALPEKRASLPLRRDTDLCPRYAALEMTLPKGMKTRGDVQTFVPPSEKPAIVDVLNYVQLELGQPMHAFDRDKIEGEIAIVKSEAEEEVVALDGKTYKVPAGAILIRDKKKTIAIAGVIGLQNSMVTEETTKIVIEAAIFDPVSVRLTARAMDIRTDASFNFERGVDPDGIPFALRRVMHLTGAAGGAGSSDSGSAHATGYTLTEAKPVEKRVVDLDLQQLRAQINSPRLEEIEVVTRFKHLGFAAAPSGEKNKLKVAVPSWRLYDVSDTQDLYEEFARSYGLNRIKLELPPLQYEIPRPTPFEELRARVEPGLHGLGFQEVITRSFYSPKEVHVLAEVDPGLAAQHVSVLNSVEGAFSHLRATQALNHARLAERSMRHGVQTFKVYEIGKVFTKKAPASKTYEYERETLAVTFAGRWWDNEFRKGEGLSEQVRHFTAVLHAIAAGLGATCQLTAGESKLLHPGYQAQVKFGRLVCGIAGVLHPRLKEACEVKSDVLYAELDVETMMGLMRSGEVAAVSDFPSIRRDLTLMVPAREYASRVSRWIGETGIDTLKDILVVDDFRKQGEEFRRITYRLTFQSDERTLASSEVDAAIEGVVNHIASKHQITLAA